MEAPVQVRLDKWLWAVRLYKSRSLATDACNAGRVKIGGNQVKPSREVRLDEILTAKTGQLNRTVRVLALLDRRVGAKVVNLYMEDLTPAEEFERVRQQRTQPIIQYPKGWGRPTKKQRRQIEDVFRPPED